MNKTTYTSFISLAVSTLLLGLIPYGVTSVRAEDGRTFPETGHTLKGLFLTYWNTHGGLAQQGYPISEELQEQSDTDGKTYTMQYFERAVFEYHPDNRPPYDVLLARLGSIYYTQRYNGDAPAQQAGTGNPLLFPETGKTIAGVFRTYWETHGALAQQGYPISDQFQEVSHTDGHTYTVQYFERAELQWHPELAGTPNEVEVALLGVSYYEAKQSGNGGVPAPGAPTPSLGAPPAAPTVGPTITPLITSNEGQLFYYAGWMGRGAIGRIVKGGSYYYYSEQKVYNTFSRSWTNIVALGNSMLFFYDRVTGSAATGRVDLDGTFTNLRTYDNLTKGWTHVVSPGNGLLLFYMQGSNFGLTAHVRNDGSYAAFNLYRTFHDGWTHIVPVGSYLLFYDASRGWGATGLIEADGTFTTRQSYTTFSKGWQLIAPGYPNMLVFYGLNGNNSTAVTGHVNADATYAGLQTYPHRLPSGATIDLGTNWTGISFINNGMQLFYDSHTGHVALWQLGDTGLYSYVPSPIGFSPDLSQIVGIR